MPAFFEGLKKCKDVEDRVLHLTSKQEITKTGGEQDDGEMVTYFGAKLDD
jgi:hypothetical protein